MIKKILIASVAIVLLSCSRDSDSPSDTAPILIKKINYLSNTGSVEGSMNFTYNGDKIIKLETSDGEEKVEYTYTGDDISKTINYVNNNITEINEYFYTGGKLTSQKITNAIEPNLNQTITYNYVNDNLVKYSEIRGYSSNNGVVTLHTTSYEVYLSNGNLNKIISTSANSGTITETYSYDDKNNIFKNVKGFIKIMMFDADGEYGLNNLKNSTRSQSLSGTNLTSSLTKTYTYNSNNFPTKMTSSFVSNTFPSETNYESYEYNK